MQTVQRFYNDVNAWEKYKQAMFVDEVEETEQKDTQKLSIPADKLGKKQKKKKKAAMAQLSVFSSSSFQNVDNNNDNISAVNDGDAKVVLQTFTTHDCIFTLSKLTKSVNANPRFVNVCVYI